MVVRHHINHLDRDPGGIVAHIWGGSIQKESEVCEREEISLVEVYERVKKFIYLFSSERLV